MLKAGQPQQAKQYLEMSDGLLMQQQVLDHLVKGINEFVKSGTGYDDTKIVYYMRKIKGLSFSRNEVFNILQDFNMSITNSVIEHFVGMQKFVPHRPTPEEKPTIGRSKGGLIIP